MLLSCFEFFGVSSWLHWLLQKYCPSRGLEGPATSGVLEAQYTGLLTAARVGAGC